MNISSKYNPPITMTESITSLVIEIGELIGQVTAYDELSKNPRLRRENIIKTIHSSLAIEQNTLTLEQVTGVIAGKRVLAPPQDIKEASNVFEAYEHLQSFDPYKVDDLLKAHRFMMHGLLEGESTIFVEFMLTMIKATLEEIVSHHDADVGINDDINVGINITDKIINLLKDNGNLTQADIALRLGISKRQVERIFRELKSNGQIMRLGSNKKGTWVVCDN